MATLKLGEIVLAEVPDQIADQIAAVVDTHPIGRFQSFDLDHYWCDAIALAINVKLTERPK